MPKSNPFPVSPRPRALIYVRVSSRNQEDGTSLFTQERDARIRAAERGYEVISVQQDVHTGKDLYGRPGLSRLLEAIRREEIDVVIAHALDRLGRTQIHLGLIFSEADHHGVAVELVTEDLEDTPEGRLLQAVRGYAAEIERLRIKERTGRGRRARSTEKGRPLPGPRPTYGYRWLHDIDKVTGKPIRCTKLAIDPDTAPVVRRIFAEAEAGKTLRGIVRGLTADGIPTATGKAVWCITTLHGILANETYTGRAVAFKRTVDRSLGMKHSRTGKAIKTRTTWLPDGDQVPLPDGTVEQLIESVQFATVRDRLARNKLEAVRNNRDPEATLLRSGFVYCADCRTALRVASDRDRPPSYIHGEVQRDRWGCGNRRVSAKEADGAALGHLQRLADEPDVVRKALETVIAAGSDLSAKLATHDRRIAEIETQQGKIARAVAVLDDDVASRSLVADAKMLASERRDLEEERAGIAAQVAARHEQEARIDAFQDLSHTWKGNLAAMTYTEKRDLMTALGLKVLVYRAGERTPRVDIETDLGPILYDTFGCLEQKVRLILRASDLDVLVAAAD